MKQKTFDRTVRDALKHYKDIEWLGEVSPLATPYFLGRFLPAQDGRITIIDRGRALQQLLLKAAESLWPGELPQSQTLLKTEGVNAETTDLKYLYLVLELRYFRRHFPPSTFPVRGRDIYDFLNVSESRFYAHLQAAQQAVSEALLEIVQPSHRLERPSRPELLIGREDKLRFCVEQLQAGRSVSVTGLVGIGKTTFASAVAFCWSHDHLFWYTFYTALNDNLLSVLFALGHFLHQHGRSQLWKQLRVHEGETIAIKHAVGFLREDLKNWDTPPLLCFDEVDLLVNSDDPRYPLHAQIAELLEALKTECPLLLVGQRARIDTDDHIALRPLTIDDVAQMLTAFDLSHLSAGQLHKVTEGNPRLIELAIALIKAGEPAGLVLYMQSSVQPLFDRLWKRLTRPEKEIVSALSVYRMPVPTHDFPESMLSQLNSRALLQYDGQGGVALMSSIRALALETISQKDRLFAHENGAYLRLQLGEYTAATYHFAQANLQEQAVNTWYQYHDLEIKRGHGLEALQILGQIKRTDLSNRGAKRLFVCKSRLDWLSGDSESIIDGYNQHDWKANEVLTSSAGIQLGRANHVAGNDEKAIETYDATLAGLNQISSEMLEIFRRRNIITSNNSDIQASQHAISKARYEVHYMEATLLMYQGHYWDSIKPLREALKIAQSLELHQKIARASYLLMMAFGNLGMMEQATQYAQQATVYYERIGDRVLQESVKAELAGSYLNIEQFEEAIPPLEESLAFFKQIDYQPRIPLACSNLAEAYFGVGDYAKAEEYAHCAIQSENQRVQAYAWYTLAQIQNKKGDMAATIYGFETGIEIAKQNEDKFIQAYLYRKYGEILLQEQQREDGFECINSAQTLFDELNMEGEKQKTDEIIAKHTISDNR